MGRPNVDPRSWERVKQALAVVLVAPAGDRTRAVDAACAGDEALRREVEEYLRYEDRAQALLPTIPCRDSPCGDSFPAMDHAPLERVGPWRVLREIGRGGMGVVYLAERDDGEYRQTAALKLVQDRRATATFVDLFRRERQILAQLDHPNIARLLDGGSTAAGQPYYVMEYVEGEPLSEYCRKRGLFAVERLRLFLKMCDGVSHAHRRLIIHRDLKPGNMLVNASGEPKLLDFGLAKVLDPTVESDLTLAGMPLLTPTYASPEQVRGEHLTTATDVYSLGVILYELLTGRLPYESKGQTLFQIWTAVCDRTPLPPGINADLDSIVMMALRKEPEKRYWSVEALQADVERYLGGLPVRARHGNAFYRMRRFVARRKWAVMAAAAAVLLACLSFAAIWREERLAEFRFNQLRQFARSVVFELHDSIEQLPGSTAARKLLVERSLRYLGSLEASSGRDLGLKWELAEAYKRIGDAQGNSARANLGDSAGAIESYSRARTLLRQIVAADAANLSARNTLASLDRSYADVLWDRGKQAESLALTGEAIGILRQVAHGKILRCRRERPWRWRSGPWRPVLPRLRTGRRRLAPGSRLWRFLRLFRRRAILRSAANVSPPSTCWRTGSPKPSRSSAPRNRSTAKVSLLPPPAPRRRWIFLSTSAIWAWPFLTTGRYPEAVMKYEGAFTLRRDAAAADPNDYRARAALGRSLDRVALAYRASGDLAAAIRSAREGAAVLAAVSAHDPGSQQYRKEAALSFARLGSLYEAKADWHSALAAYQRSSALAGELNRGMSLTEEDQRRIAAIPAALEESRRNLLPRP